MLVSYAAYEPLEVAHRATEIQDLSNTILKYSDVKPNENTYHFGLHTANHGIANKHYQANTFTSGELKGK